jgi:hypothetical protein
MVPGKLFLMDGFQEGDPCPGQSKENRQMANKLPDHNPDEPEPKRKKKRKRTAASLREIFF